MPWRQTLPMDQKTQFIADYLRDRRSMTELCELYNVSRKTGYKWVDRYLTHGPQGLEERSRRPSTSPRHTPDYVVTAILEARQRHPSWGAKKLVSILSRRHPRWPWPARSTICDILRRHGLVPKKRQRRSIGHPGKPISHIGAPNDVWSADFKGHFKTGDGRYCYPLTITDGYSRFLLSCQALSSTSVAEAKPVFTRVFKAFGLPQRIRTDNGVPFATNTLARLSQLSAWWVRLGILPEFIEPGKPQQNGRHERMHRTLKAETTRPPGATLRAQQRKFNRFRDECNHERPHEALDMRTPAACYAPPLGRCRLNFHRLSTLTASRYATSAPMVASVGTINGSTFHTSASAHMLALRKLTRGSGMCTSDPSSSGGCSNAICALKMPMVD
jgi:putative transposase